MHNILISVIAALRPEVFDMDKPVIFTYEEILYSTDGFSDSNLLGHGTYGSIYHGLLREQVCVCILKFSLLKDKHFARKYSISQVCYSRTVLVCI